MKSITNILRRSNLTPFERVVALVHNDVYREKTGKSNLSESDLHVLTKGWNPSRSEANEYNKYINIVNLENLMEMDAQMFLFSSEVALLRNQRVLDGFLSNIKKLDKIASQTFIEDISLEESVEFLKTHIYLEYEKTLHIFTFHNLSKDIQKDLLLLDEAIAYDREYLDDQIFLYERFRNGNALNKEDKDLIVNHIYSRMYHEEFKSVKNSKAEKDGFLLHPFFAELPIKDLFKKIVDDAHITYSKEDADSLLSVIEEYAKSKNVSIERLIKDKIFIWLDDGLFVKDYPPLFTSDRFDTWNGNTKNNHTVLFMAWYTEMQKSKQFFQKLFDNGSLEKQMLETDFLGIPKMVEIIIGNSLYLCKENIDFVIEYKKQIEMLMPVSNMFLFVKKHAMPIKNYKTLCGFKKLAEEVSSMFDIDMTGRYTKYINSYQEEVMLLNYSLNRHISIATESIYTEKSLRYVIDINENGFIFDLDSEEGKSDIVEKYSSEFEKLGCSSM